MKRDEDYEASMLEGDRASIAYYDRLQVHEVTDTVWNTYRNSQLGLGKSKETTGTAVYRYRNGNYECSKCLYHRCEHVKAVLVSIESKE